MALAIEGNYETSSKGASVSASPSSNPIETGRAIAEHAARLAKLELELKAVQVKAKALRFGLAAGFGLLAVLLAPLLVVFLLAAAAAALATVMQPWAAILIVSGLLLVIVAGFAGAAAMLARTKKERTDDKR